MIFYTNENGILVSKQERIINENSIIIKKVQYDKKNKRSTISIYIRDMYNNDYHKMNHSPFSIKIDDISIENNKLTIIILAPMPNDYNEKDFRCINEDLKRQFFPIRDFGLNFLRFTYQAVVDFSNFESPGNNNDKTGVQSFIEKCINYNLSSFLKDNNYRIQYTDEFYNFSDQHTEEYDRERYKYIKMIYLRRREKKQIDFLPIKNSNHILLKYIKGNI